jgi:hypothetical protein
MRALTARVSALTAVALVAGCGGSKPKNDAAVSTEQKRILRTIDQLQSASRHGDAARICKELFAEALATSIRRAAGHSCTTEVKERFTSPHEQISVERRIRVSGTHATAVIREQNGKRSNLFLVKDRGRWRIERVIAAKSR